MRKRVAVAVALSVLGGAAEPASGALSAAGDGPTDQTRPSLIAAVGRDGHGL